MLKIKRYSVQGCFKGVAAGVVGFHRLNITPEGIFVKLVISGMILDLDGEGVGLITGAERGCIAAWRRVWLRIGPKPPPSVEAHAQGLVR